MQGRAILPLVLLASCSHSANFQERLLATIPEGADVWVPPAFAPDGSTVAFVAQTPDGSFVMRESWKSRRLDAI